MALVLLLVIFLCAQPIWTLPEIVKIGAIFDTDDETLQQAFLAAITKINKNGTIMSTALNNKRGRSDDTSLAPLIESLESSNSFQASQAVCKLMSKGVAAIFGPQSRDSWAHVQSVCDTLSVPHFDTRWNYSWNRNILNSVNLFPHGPTLAKAYQSMVQVWSWNKFAVVYQDNEGLLRLNDVYNTLGRKPPKIMTVQLPANRSYHEALRTIMKEDHHNIIVTCETDVIFDVLQQAQQIGMMTDKHHYFITSLDVHTVKLDNFRYSGTVISFLRMVDPLRAEVVAVNEAVTKSLRRFKKPSDQSRQIDTLTTEAALMYDAVHTLAFGLRRLDEVTNTDIQPLYCQSNEKWKDGDTLFNYLKECFGYDGLSGKVILDSRGYRTEFKLDIMELNITGQHKIGEWRSCCPHPHMNGSIVTERNPPSPKSGFLTNQHLQIAVILVSPYIMKVESKDAKAGNERYEGFCIDVMESIAESLGFKYTLHLIPDHRQLIEVVVNKTVDLAMGDITITGERQLLVDFTTPFMNTGIGILFKTPTKRPPSLLSFLSPFSSTVWVMMGITYIVVSVTLFTVARLTPYEWDNPYPCIQDPDEVENSFTMLNSMWFTIGSLMQQGSDIAPKASSTRAMAAIWWFFTLIMISSYTANLAAFLTIENLDNPIKDAKDLEAQTKIKYGCVLTGSTKKFFENSAVELYRRMWNVMNSTESVFVADNDEGKDRVKAGNYAFLMESASIEYIKERDCNLTQIGDLLDAKGYGIAIQKGLEYRKELSGAILKLKEKGALAEFQIKWWKNKRGGGQCRQESGGSDIKALDLSNVGGIFVVLAGGGCLAVVVAVIEFWWKTRQIPRSERKPICGEMLSELTRAVQCKGTKAVVKNNEEPTSRFSLNDGYVPS